MIIDCHDIQVFIWKSNKSNNRNIMRVRWWTKYNLNSGLSGSSLGSSGRAILGHSFMCDAFHDRGAVCVSTDTWKNGCHTGASSFVVLQKKSTTVISPSCSLDILNASDITERSWVVAYSVCHLYLLSVPHIVLAATPLCMRSAMTCEDD